MRLLPGLMFCLLTFTATAGDRLTTEQLGVWVRNVDANAQGKPGRWRVVLNQHIAAIISDEELDRMRIAVPIADSTKLDQQQLERLLQADFDSALDARYCIAKGKVWALFLHPLSSLTEQEFSAAVTQVINLVDTYGKTYSSGNLMFGNGDSAKKRQDYLESVLDQGGRDSDRTWVPIEQARMPQVASANREFTASSCWFRLR